jgi:hypothetical protein
MIGVYVLVMYVTFSDGHEERRVLMPHLTYDECITDRDAMRDLLLVPSQHVECEVET